MAIKIIGKAAATPPTPTEPEYLPLSERKLPRIATMEGGTLTREDVAKLRPEDAARVLLHVKREVSRLKELASVEDAAKDRLIEHFRALPSTQRDALIVDDAVRVSYSPATTKPVVKDMKALLAALTPEEVALTYTPDMKVLIETLEKKRREKHIDNVKGRGDSLTVKDLGGDVEL